MPEDLATDSLFDMSVDLEGGADGFYVKGGTFEVSYRPTANSEPYVRTAPFFETASEKYSWLNRIVAIGVGRGQPTGVAYKVHAIL